VVLNPGAGSADRDALPRQVEARCAAAGRELRLYVVDETHDLGHLTATAVDAAARERGVVVAVGGDGTINAVAAAVLGAGLAFGVLPQGTFNYFGRAHGIPADTDSALDILFADKPAPVQVGVVDDRIFLVNASLGLHPQLLEDREAWTAGLGRRRWVAAGAAIASLLRGAHVLLLRVTLQGETRDLSTPTLFVGNNALQLASLGLAAADEVGAGSLSAHVLKPVGRFRLLNLALRGALGQLGDADQIDSFRFTQMTVSAPPGFARRHVKLALDGEVRRARLPLAFAVAPAPLWLIQPPRVARA